MRISAYNSSTRVAEDERLEEVEHLKCLCRINTRDADACDSWRITYVKAAFVKKGILMMCKLDLELTKKLLKLRCERPRRYIQRVSRCNSVCVKVWRRMWKIRSTGDVTKCDEEMTYPQEEGQLSWTYFGQRMPTARHHRRKNRRSNRGLDLPSGRA